MENLPFDPAAYEVKTCTLENNTIEYRAFEGLSYCTRPEDPIQVLNLFAPEAFYRGESINGYDLHTAPIFVLNQVGGYRPGRGSRSEPERAGHQHHFQMSGPRLCGGRGGRPGPHLRH